MFFASRLPARDARRLGTAIISHTCTRTRQLKLQPSSPIAVLHRGSSPHAQGTPGPPPRVVPIHAPVRARPARRGPERRVRRVSIHASMRARPPLHGHRDGQDDVSIHAPVRARHVREPRQLAREFVSIHAPVRARRPARASRVRCARFNPRAREGATARQHVGQREFRVSIHAPVRARRAGGSWAGRDDRVSIHAPVRARRSPSAGANAPMEFQSTRP